MHVKKSLIRRLREGKAGPFERWTADEKSISIFTAEMNRSSSFLSSAVTHRAISKLRLSKVMGTLYSLRMRACSSARRAVVVAGALPRARNTSAATSTPNALDSPPTPLRSSARVNNNPSGT